MRQFYSSHDEVLFKHTNASPSENKQQHATNAQAQKCVYLYGHNAHQRKLTPPLQKSTIMSPGWATSRTAVTKFSSCWHLRSTRLAGTSPVDTKTEMLLSPSFPAVNTCAPHAWLVPRLLTQKHTAVTKFSSCWHLCSTCLAGTLPVDTKTEMLLSSSFSAVNTCAPHAWFSNSSKCQTTQIRSGISFITIHLPNLVLTKILPGHPPHNTHI